MGIMEWLALPIIGPTFTGMVNLVLGVSIYRKKENRDWSNTLFALILISIFIWALAEALSVSFSVARDIYIVEIISYISAGLIAYFFLSFTFTFPSEDITLPKKDIVLLTAPLAIAVFLTLSGFVVRDVSPVSNYKTIIYGSGYLAYGFYIVSYFIFAFRNIIYKYSKSKGLIRTHTKYLLMSTIIPTAIGITTNLLFPTFGYFQLMWFGPLTTIILASLIFLAMRWHRLFNVKVILCEGQYLALVKKGELSKEEINFLIGGQDSQNQERKRKFDEK